MAVKKVMPPSTAKVRNGSPAMASTTASQAQVPVATASPTTAPSRSESCFPDRVRGVMPHNLTSARGRCSTIVIAREPITTSSASARRMHSALGEDPRDAREGLAGEVGYVVPAIGSWPAHPVVEWLGAGPGRFRHNDPADHPRGLVRHAVVV